MRAIISGSPANITPLIKHHIHRFYYDFSFQLAEKRQKSHTRTYERKKRGPCYIILTYVYVYFI